ncbi:ImmA/IrrE family metallo-endopeptidase [Corynebacterium sp. zg-331]|uniref:ImmA/IrrE family metallo-endopeptidase n=1 Tax=unclassified Corynebacterium TaxID=2624378 RepID=UPI00128C724F|nr:MULTISPECIES: ImmA/IrrE family metallo-endopeptidase [unclassified Corynebacterium]MBC3186397.1 ImmA/IrrE family metallo-endopeptidase [Corynebacterium sp. zg-331]MPV52883.1 ImmA/IrrE family metallo-endopeptidase [Corynebacterium sp. zg331]
MARTLSTETLIDLAEAEGISVHWHTGGPKGAWIPETQRISIRYGMSEAQTRCTLAHELGHARYGHPAGHDERHEKIAWRYAAQLLISEADYAAAERAYGHDHRIIAARLGVTQHLVGVWAETWERKRLAA